MAGLYIHIPFCKQACVYCDFHFSTQMAQKQKMVEALCKEIALESSFLPTKKLDTVYWGGGTPSVLSKEEIFQIWEVVTQYYHIDENAEITLEANPDDLSKDKLRDLAQTPINRLSVGIQSFREEDLQMMNRSHNAKQAERCVVDAQDAGFHNLSLDLIYAIPGMNNKAWEAQIHKAVGLGVPHISSYALTVEPKTVLAHKVKKGEIVEAEDRVAHQQFEMLYQVLGDEAYEHYEVSNFAKKDFKAKHNTAYWQGKPYLGIGPSAHSFKENMRKWNVANNIQYIKGIAAENPVFESEVLSEKDQFNEKVMTLLRTQKGIDIALLLKQFPLFKDYLQKEASPLFEAGKLEADNTHWYIPQKWRFQSDGIAASLFYI